MPLRRLRPLALAAALTLAWHAALFAAEALIPSFDTPHLGAALVNLATLPVALSAAVLMGDWRHTGLAPTRTPDTPRGTRAWLVLPLFAVNLVYLAQGLAGDAQALLVLAGMCLAIGLAEETLSRGVVQHALRALGPLRSAIGVGVLFGLGHALSGAWFGSAAEDVAFQVVSTTAFGFAYAAARTRLATVWPLIAAHAMDDFLQLASPGAAPWPVQLAVALGFTAYGAWLLRPQARATSSATPAN